MLAEKIRSSCDQVKRAGTEMEVVCVLGMAHSNGVANLLTRNNDSVV